ncbi:tRNA threonylcarbamoyladenosine dehydratase [Epilithonimonas hungarica]|jgi:Dinucleotide-utilizing enzymes involved in molybdopterin and thiamine biosynthesis family 1|uniref:tRNA A37 threonylcarbamoyladenosine dehydratase n=1 Tax=Epilithonimonas hungarica TaxID=454006 RepID=A0A1G7PNI7_9FLAO|nr:tRNA threonylcarbamoyladenosine dehydratase [Epilithonimonas hungarica]MDP9957506.1 tRNA A37 threonylcarbamoyladenosine dehydratase [Epilithonimonas hungarica]MPT31409.1 tRNA threonylcarbamoyladenosine dehydratase [Chryseobacterium sp.]SDF87813.1 tRNA A37 threonylcarbamoyladenosine dehydratase [Epilithonimonas hungarica]
MDKFWLERTELLIKDEGIEKLQNAKVLVVGLGGVGSFAAEFLARAGIGKMIIADGDVVDITNINRQLPALHSTIGQHKVELVGDRLMDINPKLELTRINEFLEPERMEELIKSEKFDYVLDCIDSLTPKLALMITCRRNRVKLVSSMGAGGKTDPSKVMVRDLHKTRDCLLARQVRKRLKKEKINKGFRCVFSTEVQDENSLKMTDGTNFKRSFYGTISFIPAIFGLYAAAEVINHLTGRK